MPPPEAVPPDDVPARNWQLALSSWLRATLRPLPGKSLAELENADAGPATYDRYGFRVPAVIVSPYARPGFVLSEVLDHTSVLKLIEEKRNLPPLTRRDAAAASRLGAPRPGCAADVPETPDTARPEGRPVPPLVTFAVPDTGTFPVGAKRRTASGGLLGLAPVVVREVILG